MEGETRPKSDENLAKPNTESTKEQLPSKLSSKTKIIIEQILNFFPDFRIFFRTTIT